MGGGEGRAGDTPADPPLTLETLADPRAQELLRALDRARADVAALGADTAAAPEVPAEFTARISAALRLAPPVGHPGAQHLVTGPAAAPPAHSRHHRSSRVRLLAAFAGVAAVAAAIGLGSTALLRAPSPTPSALPTAQHITVSVPPARVPLSAPQITGLLSRTPDYGALSDPQRRASCLNGLGYPASVRVLGAQPVDINGRPGVLMVLPGEGPNALVALAVAPNCSSANTGLIADTVIGRP